MLRVALEVVLGDGGVCFGDIQADNRKAVAELRQITSDRGCAPKLAPE